MATTARPLITITGPPQQRSGNENLRVDHYGDGTATAHPGRVPMAGLKGVWLEVTERIEVADDRLIR